MFSLDNVEGNCEIYVIDLVWPDKKAPFYKYISDPDPVLFFLYEKEFIFLNLTFLLRNCQI
jgi:hypothetical protein